MTLAVVLLLLFAKTESAFAASYLVGEVGDSASEQLGATVRCKATVMTPADACPDGTGFIEQLARSLDRIRPTAFENMANRFARTLTVGLEQVPMISRRVDSVIVYVGTNDSALIAGNRGYTLDAWYGDYDWLLSLIRRRAPHARMILVTIPEPAAGAISDRRAIVVRSMNRYILSRRANVLDLNCHSDFVASAFLDSSLDYLSDRGSAAIADGLLAIIKGERQGQAYQEECASFAER